MAMTRSHGTASPTIACTTQAATCSPLLEAKRCSRNAREADEQLRHYVNEIAKKQPFAPLGFMANGHDISFWEVGLANPRLVARFFVPADLERLKFLRQNRRPLEATSINSSIVDRPYQHEAIRRQQAPCHRHF
jgi:type I restriction enzyme, R subunit